MLQTFCEKVVTYEEIEGERKTRLNEGDTGRRIETNIFTYKHVHTYMPHTTVILHTYSLPHQHFYTQSLLRTNTVTHKHFYTQTLLHKRFYTETLLHTNTLNADAFTYNHFYTQALLHTSTCTRRPFTRTNQTRKKNGLTLKHHFVRKGCRRGCKIAILPQLLTLELHFERQGCRGGCKIAILRQFLTIEHYFVAPRRHRPKERREKEGERPCERERERRRESDDVKMRRCDVNIYEDV